ncbi:MAG: RNA ligase partner protein [candidate division WOR-3 bacterium]
MKKKPEIKVYLTPNTLNEISTFVQIPSNFQKFFRVKSPNKYKIKIPGIILYNFVGEMRDRINRGLRVSEKAVREFNDKDNAIRYLRENYRRVMREGIVDSKEDIDTILLAIEQKAILSTADEGQIKLAMELGIEIIEPKNFYNLFL